MRGADVGQYSDFIEGLGPGQLVGRQVLGASSLGDIQLSMCHQKGCLEVEVIRARGLQVWKHFQPFQKLIRKRRIYQNWSKFWSQSRKFLEINQNKIRIP